MGILPPVGTIPSTTNIPVPGPKGKKPNTSSGELLGPFPSVPSNLQEMEEYPLENVLTGTTPGIVSRLAVVSPFPRVKKNLVPFLVPSEQEI